MIEDIIKKFEGRFKQTKSTTYDNTTLLPTYNLLDVSDGERFSIQIDSLSAMNEIIVENVLRDKIISKRDRKIDSIFNERTT
jgi:hypothetical protein